MIDLTARLLGTTAKEAATALSDDFHLDTERRQQITEYRRPAIKQFRQDEAECASVLAEFLHLLQSWKMQNAPVSPEDPSDDHYILACRELEKAEYVFDLLSVGLPEERIELVDDLISSGKLARLKQAIADIKKEGDRHEEARAS